MREEGAKHKPKAVLSSPSALLFLLTAGVKPKPVFFKMPSKTVSKHPFSARLHRTAAREEGALPISGRRLPPGQTPTREARLLPSSPGCCEREAPTANLGPQPALSPRTSSGLILDAILPRRPSPRSPLIRNPTSGSRLFPARKGRPPDPAAPGEQCNPTPGPRIPAPEP